ncbi:cytochrome c oxidase accessory protein CcoG [Lujinxingia litoralis]|uniref:Cytochrome c oxidase accessory protein CcoG n=1 Tax=Lujinxingia litoralis TaxID=2211119 RepID=A0A328C6G6_9DELT|nr:cytochrome c oxidase accessory protein CcoG [Lujinxingia litoralis]RAL23109.1 cytochrome c oxidase accessory protein CcoG [Lujinxingia litoralis]
MSTPPILESPDAVLSTMDKDGKRRWIYPTLSPGRFLNARRLVGFVLIAFFVALPWINIADKPAIFLNLTGGEFTFFGLTLHATDTVLLMVFLLTILLSVFFFTALFGRVWCGWGCPQTVYLEFVFRPIERLIEGKESARRRRDQGPWTGEKVARKGLKLVVFGALSLFLAHTFVAYFVSWPELLRWMSLSPTEHPGYFATMAITTALIFFDFGYFREQMCTITCPYARFQSVLMDRHSLIVSYDPNRGEPRGKRKRAKSAGPIDLDQPLARLGDCIDCGACVRTCPTGIDIREGLQMECISCTQCVDACDSIMDAIDKPRGLIRYTSENAIAQKPTRVIRPRTVAYGVLLVVLSSVLVALIGQRSPLEVDIGRMPGPAFTELADGQIANRLRVRLRNRTGEDRQATLRLSEPAGAQVRVVGPQTISLNSGELSRFEVWVTAPPEALPDGSATATFEVIIDGEPWATSSFPLLGPTSVGE